MHLLRTRFKQDILAVFLCPKKKSNKAIIFCDGMPSMPNKKKLMEFWSRKGFWVFYPRYRGTWESDGDFLADSPEKDIIDIVDDLSGKKQIFSLWDELAHEINIKEIFIIGVSFGGSAAILASRDERVKKVVCVSPVVDWTASSEEEPLDYLGGLVKKNFGQGYRFRQENWDKLGKGEFYNPVKHIDEIDGNKIMIIHAEDDKIVHAKEVKEFAEKINCKFYLLKKGGLPGTARRAETGHLSSSILIKLKWYRRVKNFFKV